MKKIFSLLIVIILAATSLASCKNKETDIPKGMKLAENEYTKYSFFVPEDWTVDIANGFTSAYANDKSNVSLAVFTWSSQYKSIQEYCDSYFKNIDSTFKEVSEREFYSENQYFGDMPALKYVYTMSSNGEIYKIMQLFSYDAGSIYIFTYTATEKNYENHISEVNSVTENFRK